MIRWYQRQIYVKLCRAASGTIRSEMEDTECFQEDADGSAKVALIGIERSIPAWATLLRHFPDHEDALFALGTLKRLLRQVEAAFPNARVCSIGKRFSCFRPALRISYGYESFGLPGKGVQVLLPLQ